MQRPAFGPSRRRVAARSVLALAVATTPSMPAAACDLFGPRAAVPYAAGYTPLAAAPVQPLVPPAAAAAVYPSVVAARPALPLTAAAPVAAYRPATTAAYPLAAPAYAAAPPYAAAAVPLDNPSVYTGLPAGGAVPLAANLRGVSPATNIGATNVYPTNTSSVPYIAGYGSAAGLPTTPIAGTAGVAPMPLVPDTRGPLQRLFGGLFGTNYVTAPVTAPTTYYRPATTLSPATGLATTTQVPCAGEETLMQRTPLSAVQFGGGETMVPVGPPVRVADPDACGVRPAGGFGDLGYDDPGYGGGVRPADYDAVPPPTLNRVPIESMGYESSEWRPTGRERIVPAPAERRYAPSDRYRDADPYASADGDDYGPLTADSDGTTRRQSRDDFAPIDPPRLRPRTDLRRPGRFDDTDRFEDDYRGEPSPSDRRRVPAEDDRFDDDSYDSYWQRDDEPAGRDQAGWRLPAARDTDAMVPVRRDRRRSFTDVSYQRDGRGRQTDARTGDRFTPAPAARRPDVSDVRRGVEPIRGLDTDPNRRPDRRSARPADLGTDVPRLPKLPVGDIDLVSHVDRDDLRDAEPRRVAPPTHRRRPEPIRRDRSYRTR